MSVNDFLPKHMLNKELPYIKRLLEYIGKALLSL
jgi:hypothetical protein